MSNTFGELVKRERKQKEISLAKLSQLMNDEINPSYINRLEKGEKENPGFRIVLGLCKALNLNMKEVYRSFGFESLASDESEQNNEFSIEDLFRLHNIVAPTANVHEDLGHGQLNYIDHSEKETLISVISTIINYASEEEVNVDTLALILKQVEKVRGVYQEVASKSEVITVEVEDINYTLELHHLL
ncbi:helix-turn-helix domain-containing protein, partial [Halalkalibacter akibai]|uniref:helix-turn-helix domain-containing protein n=1 Tax=Halalkalibacter akibai TaxID=1411 RepID=UPI00055006A5